MQLKKTFEKMHISKWTHTHTGNQLTIIVPCLSLFVCVDSVVTSRWGYINNRSFVTWLVGITKAAGKADILISERGRERDITWRSDDSYKYTLNYSNRRPHITTTHLSFIQILHIFENKPDKIISQNSPHDYERAQRHTPQTL